MSAAALAACLVLASAPAASAQVVSSGPLGQVDPWGVGWLGRADGALPATLWTNTDTEALAALFEALKPGALSPAARDALRRVVLSSARGPEGDVDLIPERLRVIEALGETRRSIELRRRFPDKDWGKAADRLASDYDLAAGKTQDGCARVATIRADDPDWMPVRALCLALAGDFNGAGMVSERAAAAENVDGAWFIAAIETMRGPTRRQPDGRYGSAFEAAVSISAKLSASADAFRDMAPDLAAAILHHPAASLDQRRAALRPALEGGTATPTDALAVLTAKEDAPAQAGKRVASSSRMDFLALALDAVGKEGAEAAQATAYAAALKGADNAADFRLAAFALIDAIRKLPLTEVSSPHAETFARAAILTGDIKLASDWRKLMGATPGDKADVWAMGRIDLMLALTGQGADKAGEIIGVLMSALEPLAEGAATKAATPAQRQADLRRIENTRILFLYSGTGRALTPAQRMLLSGQRTAGRGVSDAVLSSIHASLTAKADGEALLAAIGQLSGDTSALSFAGLSDLLTLLRRAGFEKEADALFLEALQVWKAI